MGKTAYDTVDGQLRKGELWLNLLMGSLFLNLILAFLLAVELSKP